MPLLVLSDDAACNAALCGAGFRAVTEDTDTTTPAIRPRSVPRARAGERS